MERSLSDHFTDFHTVQGPGLFGFSEKYGTQKNDG